MPGTEDEKVTKLVLPLPYLYLQPEDKAVTYKKESNNVKKNIVEGTTNPNASTHRRITQPSPRGSGQASGRTQSMSRCYHTADEQG